MPTRRYFSNFAPRQTLANSIGSSDTTCQIAGSFAGWPVQFPFYVTLGYGLSSAEIVQVTNIVGTTATIVRAQDGSAAVAHPAGETMDQTAIRLDYDEANAHTSASAGVHGVTGNVVGDVDAQTLTNKTLTDPTVNAAVLTGSITNRAKLVGDVSDPGVLGQSASGGKSLSLQDHTGTEKVSVDDNGNLIVAGTATTGALSAPSLALTAIASITDYNSAITTGFYYAPAGTAHAPDSINAYSVEVIAGNSGNQIAQIAWASDGQTLGFMRSWTVTAWSSWQRFATNKPLFVATQATAQSLASGSFGWINFDTTVVDTAGGHGTGANNYKYTVQNLPGWHRITGRFALSSSAAHVQSAGVAINGSTPVASSLSTIYTGSAGYVPAVQTTTVQYLNVGDWCSIMGEHTVGSATSTAAGESEFTVEWIHD